MKETPKKAPGNQAIQQLQCPGKPKNIPDEPLHSYQTDPFGSYTGNSIDGDVPVQDADDL